ncbi:CAP domain-containing protein [Corticibacterium sp. UT-5YL-CI-8]|nr:CAP domain-containing protein [Tianweitania sp. UT-5YL-CI-8]
MTDSTAPTARHGSSGLRFRPASLVLAASLCAALLSACQTGGRIEGGAIVSPQGQSYLNDIRAGQGMSAMTPDAKLGQAALQQAGYMAGSGKMVHTTGRGKDFATRIKDNEIEGAASENIAQGRMDMAKLFQMWRDSPAHRRNMLDERFNRFGLAYVTRGGERYWALVMGR